MQGRRSILDSFPDTIDLNQASVSNSTDMNQSAAWDSLLNPVENRLPTMLSSDDRSVSCTSTSSHNARSFSGWEQGQSSSSGHLQDRVCGDDLKIGYGWSTSSNPDARMQEHRSEQYSVLHRESAGSYSGNHVGRRTLNMPDSSSNTCHQNPEFFGGYMGNTDGRWQNTSTSLYWSGRSETQEPCFSAENIGASSSSSGYLMEYGDGSGSSLSAWGSSGKRKALEGSSAQLHLGGSSSSHPLAENVGVHMVPAHHNASGSMNMPSPPMDWSFSSQPERLHPRNGFGLRGTTSEIFPPLSMSGTSESSSGNVVGRMNFGHHEPDSFTSPFAETVLGPSGASSSHQPSRLFTSNDSSMLMNSCNPVNQSHVQRVPGFGGSMHPLPWNVSPEAQGVSSSNSFMFSGERGAALRDGQNSRSSLRNDPEFSASVTASETRSLVQGPSEWNFATGNARSSRSLPSSSRSGSSSSMHNLPTIWTPHQNPAPHNQQGLSEYAPWSLFPPRDPDYGSQRTHFPVMPPVSSSSREAPIPSSSSRRRHHQVSRSPVMMDAPGDAISGWRALAVDIEGRHRLIRQVLNAVRRGDNLRGQDYVVFDQFINGVAEVHDRHSDMRLDVDNMSYEELLALEERIGNVSTGLSDQIIAQSMKQQKYKSTGSSSSSEPCCICREEYVAGDDIGTVDCGHEFHAGCIKQWLSLKNLCPICKMTALKT